MGHCAGSWFSTVNMVSCLTLSFPLTLREGNDWSYSFCRRQWSLADSPILRYGALLAFEASLHAADDMFRFVGSPHQIAFADEERQVSSQGLCLGLRHESHYRLRSGAWSIYLTNNDC